MKSFVQGNGSQIVRRRESQGNAVHENSQYNFMFKEITMESFVKGMDNQIYCKKDSVWNPV